MLRILDATRSAPAHERHRFVPPRWAPLTALRATCEALREGLAVHREYEALRSKGVPHDAALREALAIGATPAWQTCRTVAPLYFAGRA
jgi:hypothetical protein